MESPGTTYLYTLALLGMTFMGFAAIVMLLRQTLGRHLRAFDVLFARVYMEFALIVSMGAMLPPLLMLWELPIGAVWRLSSGLVGIPLLGIALEALRRAVRLWGFFFPCAPCCDSDSAAHNRCVGCNTTRFTVSASGC